jgi:hypothetical protein
MPGADEFLMIRKNGKWERAIPRAINPIRNVLAQGKDQMMASMTYHRWRGISVRGYGDRGAA